MINHDENYNEDKMIFFANHGAARRMINCNYCRELVLASFVVLKSDLDYIGHDKNVKGCYNMAKFRDSNDLIIFFFQEWFSRQQLMMVVLFVNVTLAIMFFKLLT